MAYRIDAFAMSSNLKGALRIHTRAIELVLNLVVVGGRNDYIRDLGHGNFCPSFEIGTVWGPADALQYPDGCVHELMKESRAKLFLVIHDLCAQFYNGLSFHRNAWCHVGGKFL